MSVESVAREFITQMGDIEMTKKRITADAMASGGVLPKPMPALDALHLIAGLKAAMPDLKWNVDSVSVSGNKATIKSTWSGTQTGKLDLGMPGMSALPPTGKKVSVKDDYIVTVQGDKVSHLEVNSPANGGIPGALAQLGMKMPSM